MVKYIFLTWSDGNTNPSRPVNTSVPLTLSATYQPQGQILTGIFHITTTPSPAPIFVDDVYVGESPIDVPVEANVNHTVTCGILDGWVPPGPYVTMVAVNGTVNIHRSYTQGPSGFLQVDTSPVTANIYGMLKGAIGDPQFLGTTPLNVVLAVGTWLIYFGAVSGYEPPQPNPREVPIYSGQITSIFAVYNPVPTGTLTVNTDPFSVNIYIDGELAGKTPLSIDLNPGPHLVQFEELDGYNLLPDRTVNIVSGDTTSIETTYVRRGDFNAMWLLIPLVGVAAGAVLLKKGKK